MPTIISTHSILISSVPRENKLLAGKIVPQGINTNPYFSEPAPMGISDIGVSPNGPFIRESTQFLGVIDLYSLSAESSFNTPCAEFQLNLVLNYNYNGQTYALWTQDVAHFNTVTHQIFFLDNIWNFTAYKASVTGVVGNGQISYSNSSGMSYYYYCASTPGNGVSLTLPTTIYLLINVTENSAGQPVIMFWYNDGYGWINYDRVTVTNVYNASNVSFLVDGYQYTGSGNYYDAELVLTGPGGGSCAYLYSSTLLYLSLEYWNGHNFQGVRNAYNYGFDTAEKVNNANVMSYYSLSNGEYVAGITAGVGFLEMLWQQDTISTLKINTGVNSGYAIVFNASVPLSEVENDISLFKVPFSNGGEVCLTLYPMEYGIIVFNSNGQMIGEASVVTTQGEAVSTNVSPFSISVVNYNILYHEVIVTLQINGFGYVTLYTNSTYPYTFQTNPIYVNGKAEDTLTIYDLPYGVEDISIYGYLFNGFYSKVNLSLIIQPQTVPITFSYSFIGNQPPTLPTITFNFPNGTTETVTLQNGQTISLPSGTNYTIQNVINDGNIRWATQNTTSGVVTSKGSLYIVYYEQDEVTFYYNLIGNGTFTIPTINYEYFNEMRSVSPPATVWVNYDSAYTYTKILNGVEPDTRAIALNYTGIITAPEVITVNYQVQYFINVNSPIPLYALINGENESFSSNWFNQGDVVQIENLSYYISSMEREIITSLSPSFTFTVEEPMNVNVKVVNQYYVTVNSTIPIYALINGQNVSLNSGWYNYGISVNIENITYYVTPLERDIIISISPKSFIVNNHINVDVKVVNQYYIKVLSKVSVKGEINGSERYLNSSWINSGSYIKILNYTYYVNNQTRCIITKITPSNSFTLNTPITINITTQRQYLVVINGESIWVNNGSVITLSANVPFYLMGKYVGTYNVSSGISITVDQPIQERFVEVPNYLIIGLIGAIITISVIVSVIILRKRK
ncbi:thermopsin [Sulfolobus tengchongensis]|uniref:Thermopsin n=1 Tax=Sulfolobus tengchongensis TaxID=207809 RepID=A0AAX4L324_9CREN